MPEKGNEEFSGLLKMGGFVTIGRMKTLRIAVMVLLTALSQWGLWLAYTSSVGYRELCAGAGAAAIAPGAVWVLAGKGKICFRFRWRQAAQAIYVPWNVIVDTWKLMRAVAMQVFSARGAPSLLAAVEFEAAQNDPAAAGREALAITFMTITPNSVVLGIVPDQGVLLYHQIIPSPVATAARHLGARP